MLEQECFSKPGRYEIIESIYFNTCFTANDEEWISLLIFQDCFPFIFILVNKEFTKTSVSCVYVQQMEFFL